MKRDVLPHGFRCPQLDQLDFRLPAHAVLGTVAGNQFLYQLPVAAVNQRHLRVIAEPIARHVLFDRRRRRKLDKAHIVPVPELRQAVIQTLARQHFKQLLFVLRRKAVTAHAIQMFHMQLEPFRVKIAFPQHLLRFRRQRACHQQQLDKVPVVRRQNFNLQFRRQGFRRQRFHQLAEVFGLGRFFAKQAVKPVHDGLKRRIVALFDNLSFHVFADNPFVGIRRKQRRIVPVQQSINLVVVFQRIKRQIHAHCLVAPDFNQIFRVGQAAHFGKVAQCLHLIAMNKATLGFLRQAVIVKIRQPDVGRGYLDKNLFRIFGKTETVDVALNGRGRKMLQQNQFFMQIQGMFTCQALKISL
ncbi:unknown [Acetobacter sp. CAG:267]|nr:unknown [Acetobacter sp. CAG:267]